MYEEISEQLEMLPMLYLRLIDTLGRADWPRGAFAAMKVLPGQWIRPYSASMINGRSANPVWLRVWLVAGLAAFAGLCACVLSQNKPPFFDETYYLAQAKAYDTDESFKAWLVNNQNGPAGPVHALMHYGLSGGKGFLAAPWFRAPNLVLLAGVLLLTGFSIKTHKGEDHWGKALVGLAIPMSWVFAGMALTELPAMIGIAAALYAAARLDSGGAKTPGMTWTWAGVIACGVAIAVCGRQTYLVAVPAVLLIAARDRTAFLSALAGVITGILPALLLFYTWGGLVPPKMAYVGNGLALQHGVLALGYVGLTTLLVAPGYLISHWRIATPVSLTAVVFNLMTDAVDFSTMTTVQKLIGYPEFTRALVWMGEQLFVFSGTAFFVTTLAELIEHRDRRFAGYAYGVMSLCAACIAVTLFFSSRYTGMNLPFLLPMLSPWIRFTPWAVMRWLFGMSLGAAVLYSYYTLT